MLIDSNTFQPNKLFNRIKLVVSYFLRRPEALGMPVEASIEVTTRCNLDCIMCPRGAINRPIKDMDFSLFKRIIDEIKDFAELIYLHGLGEPLLNKNLFKMIEYAKKKGIRVGISTNATLLDKEKADKLLNSGIDYIIFALDAVTKKTYEKIRRQGKFEKAVNNTRYFLKRKRELNLPIFGVVQMVVMPENQKERGKFLKMWQNSGVDMARVKPVVDFLHRQKPRKAVSSQPCFYPYRMVNIYFNGTVVPCCEDNFGEYPLGNIKEKSLKEIFNGQPARNLRKKIAQGRRKDIVICQKCTYPQPSILGILGVTLFDNLTVKKILPFLERLPIFRNKLLVYD